MAENKESAKWPRRIGLCIAAIVCGVIIYVLAVLLSGENEKAGRVVSAGLEAKITATEGTDVKSLAGFFGAAVPVTKEKLKSGYTQNEEYAGMKCARIHLEYENGMTVEGVRPAAAAPLILREEMSLVMDNSLSLCNMPAYLTEKNGEYCLYCTAEDAFFSIVGTAESREAYLTELDKIELVSE